MSSVIHTFMVLDFTDHWKCFKSWLNNLDWTAWSCVYSPTGIQQIKRQLHQHRICILLKTDQRNFVISTVSFYVLLKCCAIGSQKHNLMEHVAHQCICMQYILELSKQLDVDPRACVSSFFSRYSDLCVQCGWNYIVSCSKAVVSSNFSHRNKNV
jgi:hypothetical protein